MRLRRRWAALVVLVALVPVVAAVRVRARVLASLRPPRAHVGTPDGLARVRDVQLVTRDGVSLRGWYVPSRNGAAVILGHGWAGQRATLLPEARALAARGYGVAMFDWRGHGESGGARTTWGVDEQRDLDAVINYVVAQPEVDAQRVGAIGFSMGGMIIAQVAEHDLRLRAIAVEGTHASLAAEMRYDERRWGWWSGAVAEWTLRRAGIDLERERPADALCRLSPRPLLVIGGSADAGLPVEEAEQMYARACRPKQLVIVPGATHGGYARTGGADFDRRLVAFFDGALPHDVPGTMLSVASPAPRAPLARQR